MTRPRAAVRRRRLQRLTTEGAAPKSLPLVSAPAAVPDLHSERSRLVLFQQILWVASRQLACASAG